MEEIEAFFISIDGVAELCLRGPGTFLSAEIYNSTTIKVWILQSQAAPEYKREFHSFEKRAKFYASDFVYLGVARDKDSTRFIFEKIRETPAPLDGVLAAVFDGDREV